MRLIALLSVKELDREPPIGGSAPTLRFGSQSLVEYQARQALAAGADELIIHADAASGDLMQATDRLSRETDVPITLVGNGRELARRLAVEDRVLMLAERMILPLDCIAALADEQETTLLVTPSLAGSAMLERIDSSHVWAGGALISGAIVLSTVDMVGEWDLVLTLLRCAVQQQARRIEISTELIAASALVSVRDQADADRALNAMSAAQAQADAARADGLTIALDPVARKLVAETVRRQLDPTYLSQGAGALAVAATAAVTLDWSIVALLLALLGETAFALGARGAAISLRKPTVRWLGLLVRGAGLTVLAGIGGRLAGGNALALAGVGMPLMLLALIALTVDRLTARPRWAVLARPTVALSLLIALLFTIVGNSALAFVAIGLLALVTVAFQLLSTNESHI